MMPMHLTRTCLINIIFYLQDPQRTPQVDQDDARFVPPEQGGDGFHGCPKDERPGHHPAVDSSERDGRGRIHEAVHKS